MIELALFCFSFSWRLLLSLLPLVAAGLVLRTIDRAAKQRQRPVRILLVDFFSLIFLVQLPYAIVFQFSGREDLGAIFTASIYAVVMLVVWWVTIRSVSQAGIFKVTTRAWISLLVIPMTYIGSLAMIGVGFGIANRIEEKRLDDVFLQLFIVEIVLVMLMCAAHFVTRRAILNSPQRETAPIDDQER